MLHILTHDRQPFEPYARLTVFSHSSFLFVIFWLYEVDSLRLNHSIVVLYLSLLEL